MPSVRFVQARLAVYVPTFKLLAAVSRLTVIETAGPPGNKVPLFVEAESQKGQVPRTQFKGAEPIFVRKKLCDVTLNGPPILPLEELLVPGVKSKVPEENDTESELLPFATTTSEYIPAGSPCGKVNSVVTVLPPAITPVLLQL